MSYYQRHIFFCLNQRDNGENACAQHGAKEASTTARARIKAEGPDQAACASTRPAASTAAPARRWPWSHPEAVWYTYVDQADIDEIVDKHLKKGQVVERLPDCRRAWAGEPQTVTARARPGRECDQCAIDLPPTPEHGVAVICHPHPQHGGTMDNKVGPDARPRGHRLGWRSVRFNFRGVGASGAWDEGRGEDRRRAGGCRAMRRAGEPLLLAASPSGAYVASQAAAHCPMTRSRSALALVGPSTQKRHARGAGRYRGDPWRGRRRGAALRHAQWARPQALPVIVFPAPAILPRAARAAQERAGAAAARQNSARFFSRHR